MKFLGMIIGQGKIGMDPIKLTAIKEWKPPTSVKGIHFFLDFANFSHVITSLNLHTKKDQP